MSNTYQRGDLVRVTGTFTTSAAAVTDPATVKFKYKKPDGTSVTLTYGVDAALVKSSTGVYYVDIDAAIKGVYYYRMYSEGSGQAAAEGDFLAENWE